ncbi:MAG: hypothetical protein IJW25_03445 [Clostridia bacterium]|nr:hypothetical protein [Clostridia bacterium]
MDILNNIDEKEVIDINAEVNVSKYIKNVLLANIIYIILWIAFDIFFIFLMTKDAVSSKFWFVSLPICGFNIIRLWAFISKILKEVKEIKDTGYVLTNKAIYYYSNNKYKELKRIALEDIVAVEKSEYMLDGFFVATQTATIHIKNIVEEKELFDSLTQILQK